MEESPAVPDVEALLTKLRARVEERRSQGVYPHGLEAELDDHFRRIATHRTPANIDDVRAKLFELEHRIAFDPDIAVDSRVPGGAALHAAVARLVGRQTQGILEQVRAFAEGVRDVVQALALAVENPQAHVHADLVGQLDAVFERLAAYERVPDDSSVEVADLYRRLDRLEAIEHRRRFNSFFSNEAFEETFRGEREELLGRYRDLVAVFDGLSPVLDIGCGRGELLGLFGEVGIEARGVDIDPELVKQCRADGLDVRLGDALTALADATDRSLGGISLIQVVEHMEPQDVTELVLLARDKLYQGGKVLIETVNPQSLYVYAHSFYVDPTHRNPVHPGYLSFLFREAGFSNARLELRSAVGDDARLAPVPGDDDLVRTMNDNIDKLNALVFGPQDYAIIATL
jgi:SAM-dependent methyltransferase